MDRRQRRRDHKLFKIFCIRQKTCNCKYINDLDKFGRLDGYSSDCKRQFRAIGRGRRNRDKRQKADTGKGIEPVHFCNKPEFPDNDRNQKCDHRCDHCNLELLDALVIIQAGDHNESGTDQHTHIIDQQTGSKRIQIPEQDKHCRQIKRLRTVKQQK